ncbi:MAG: CCA-adding enzyme [marine bacterium B5-7]|nr:MAG: CCA-adding enzyme [marine bacterium B5-7]
MKTYLVGGAVRDQLLDLPVKERDWVVVGATPETLLSQGYQAVGKDFPVFLHPETHEEYALARTERKTGKGYTGFDCYAAPDVTLEQDLLRRDLTINAIAQTPDGGLVDPFNGQADIQAKVLRHVSPAFVEDPVRILRLARFAARFADFSVAPETMQLMQQMVKDGEVDALVPERVWQEWQKSLSTTAPHRFIEVLRDANALNVLLPELMAQRDWHQPETEDCQVRFSALFKGIPSTDVSNITKRFRVPNDYSQLAILTAAHHEQLAACEQGNAEMVLQLLEKTDALRRPERFQQFLLACDMTQSICGKALTAVQHVDVAPFVNQGLKGQAIAEALREARLQALQRVL